MAKPGRKPKTKVDKIIEADLSLPATLDLVREFIKVSNIEKCKEEGFVLKQLLQGKNPHDIIRALKRKHPTFSFDYNDFNRFIERNKEIRSVIEKENHGVSRRFKKAKADVEELMGDLLLFNKELIRELYDKEDATNLNAAIRNLNQTLMNYAKLAGYLDESDMKSINVVNVLTDKHEAERLKDKIHKADFKEEPPIEVTIVEEKREEKDKGTGDEGSKDDL